MGLFSGPYRREFASGDLHFEQVICNFSHVRGAGASVSEYLVLSILHAAKAEEALRGQIEAAADKLAEILVEGKKLGTSYTFQGDRLMEGLPPYMAVRQFASVV